MRSRSRPYAPGPPPLRHAARTGFAASLLAVGGLQAETGAVGDYSATLSPVVVLCGSDAAYQAETVDAARRLKIAGARRVWLAGRPRELEPAWREAGVDDFVFTGCDVVSALDQALTELER